MSYICPICKNSDEKYIGYFNSQPYCRLCLDFQGKKADNNYQVTKDIIFNLEYPLSEKQEKLSKDVYNNLIDGKNVLINAVTGAGKTELVFLSMYEYLKRGLHVGFATPRKDVIIDLFPRFQKAFKNLTITTVYGEHTNKLNADIILLTCHQLYRYPNYFDLLILDEVDAFPYYNNEVLHNIFYNSIRKNFVMMSATIDEKLKNEILSNNGVILSLYERYHGGKLIVPKVIKCPYCFMPLVVINLLYKFINSMKPVFIFAPKIEDGKQLFKILHLLFKKGEFVSSKEEYRSIFIDKFKNKELDYLVTTSILERGVTVKDLQVIVYMADDEIYDEKTLIQIAGRVGRKSDAKTGEVYFLACEKTRDIKSCINTINGYNKR